jgi:8-oxo-dGTP diphosphatase
MNQDERAFLERYDPGAYPAVAVTVDIVLLTLRHGRLACLLVERAAPPFQGCWALPGGFVRPDETLEDAARRRLSQETGVARLPPAMHLEQLCTYGDPDRDPRMRVVTVAYLGLAPDVPVPVACGDAAQARFWPVEDLDAPDGPALAFDHARILGDGLERARSKLEYTALATAFVDEPFTVADLRRVYDAVWGTRLDPANFQRKVLGTADFLRPAASPLSSPGGPGRPARLYRRGTAALLHPPMLRPTTPRVVQLATPEAPCRAATPGRVT